MNQFLLVSIVSIGFLSACSSGSSSNNGTPASGTAQAEPEQIRTSEVTDKSSCHGPSTIGDSPYRTWRGEYSGTGEKTGMTLVISMRLKFSANRTMITNECTINGQTSYAEINVATKIDEANRTIEFLESKSDSNKIGSVTCNVSAQSRKFSYEIEGNCLKATMNGQSGFFVAD